MGTSLFTVGKGVLLPRGESARQMLAEHQVGDDVEIDVLDPEDGYTRRVMFAVIGKLAKWRGVPREEMRASILIALGRFRMVSMLNGKRIMVIHSMDRRALKGAELQLLYDDFRAWLTKDVLRMPNDLALEISTMMERADPNLPDIPEDEPW